MVWKRFGVTALACAVALICAAGLSHAQDGKKSSEAKSSGKEEVKGRLPIYFGQIGLSKKQEDEVRKSAQPFDERISQIRKQMDELEKQVAEQETAKLATCEKQLTDGQMIALKERRAQAEADKAARKKSKKAANGDEKKSEGGKGE